ncbi:MAG: protein-disulfide reductase DsbD domain-containing protein [Planctomycetota bacterium]|nr:protein-disulfide reductase DsbD domain-containing protein [Planctomycetota bacterium]
MCRIVLRPWSMVFLSVLAAGLAVGSAAGQKLQDPISGLGLPGFGVGDQSDSETVTVDAEILPAANGGQPHLLITAKIIPGWHISSITQQAGGPKKTEIRLEPSAQYRTAGEVVADPAATIKEYEFWDVPAEEHHGSVAWRIPVELAGGLKMDDVVIKGGISGQACKEACILFDVKFEARVTTVHGLGPVRLPPVAGNPASPEFVAGHVTVGGGFDRVASVPGESLQLQIQFQCDEGWHVYELLPRLPENRTFSFPTLIAIDEPSGLQFSPPSPDKPLKTQQQSDQAVNYYEGGVTMTLQVTVPQDAAPGLHPISGIVAFQLCHERGNCEQPVAARFSAKLNVAGQGQRGTTPLQFVLDDAGYKKAAEEIAGLPNWEVVAGTAAASGGESWIAGLPLYAILGVAFAAGFILNFMPCVLPVIGLKIMSFVQQAGENRRRILTLNVWFSLGLMSVFWILATLPIAVGLATEGSASLGWGEHYSIASFNIVLTSIVFAFALSFLGVWEIPIPGFVGTSSANEIAEKEGATGAFFKGILATVLATPCTGPLLIPATTWAFNQPTQITYLAFTFIGFGMASPYLLIGAFPRLIAFLPKPGAWMEVFKQVMGFILMGTVVWLLSSLRAEYHSATLALFVAIAFGCWAIGRVPLTADSSVRTQAWLWAVGTIAYVAVVGYGGNSYVTAMATVVSAIAIGVWVVSRIPDAANLSRQIWGWAAAGVVVVSAASVSWIVLQSSQLPWEPFTRATLDDLRNQGQTVLVDFTADW